MSLRRQNPHDSLYMLLDTMCNTFGGIILLAVMVTLLTSREKQARSGTTGESDALVQSRLMLAQTNLQQSWQLAAALQARTNDARWRDQLGLLAARQELQSGLELTRETVQRDGRQLEAASSSSDPAARAKFLKAQLAEAQLRKVEAQNALAATEENKRQLQKRLETAARQVNAKLNESVRTLRLPKEYQTEKQIVYLIARYGRIYPCRNADMSRNETSISWTTSLREEKAEPIPGRGIDVLASPRELERYYHDLSRDSVYLAFCVYEDSFPSFLRAEQLAWTNGFATGWDPFSNARGAVVFSQYGHKPKPQ